MDAYLSEYEKERKAAPEKSIYESVAGFTDEIEGELEKVSVYGIHCTRNITLSILGVFALIAISLGASLGVKLTSPTTATAATGNVDTIDATGSPTTADFFNIANAPTTHSPTTANGGMDPSPTTASKEVAHNYWSFGEAIEAIIGQEIYDDTTREHEALVWFADTDPLKLDPKTTPIDDILQRYIIANFYFATNGTTWPNQFNFLSKDDVCDWNDSTFGVFCDDDGRVSSILMQDCALHGTIPQDIGLLSHMEIFNLTKNDIHGDIPMSLGTISGLTHVDMSVNGFSGQIPPSIAMLLELEVLDLSFNALIGGLEGNIGHLEKKSENLRAVDLSFNMIKGTIPESFGEGTNLNYLYLNNNNLHGLFPKSIGNLNTLVELDISNNELSGSLPSALGDLSMLEVLNLSFNALIGGDGAKALKDLTKLEELYMSHNLLEGNVGHFGKSESLRIVDISFNFIEGTIPGSFGEGMNLKYLYLNNNNMDGLIPTTMGDLKSLVELDISNNRLTGSLPSNLGDLTTLQILKLHSNNLQDALPTEISNLGMLEELDLSNNRFEGRIPSELSNLFLLTTMDISNNDFAGDMDLVFCVDNRPEWGNPIESYRADCLTDDISFSCATECCDGNKYCCVVPGEANCRTLED